MTTESLGSTSVTISDYQPVICSDNPHQAKAEWVAARATDYPKGTVLGRKSDGTWLVYDATKDDGTETPRGVLLEDVDADADDAIVAEILRNGSAYAEDLYLLVSSELTRVSAIAGFSGTHGLLDGAISTVTHKLADAGIFLRTRR